MRPLPALAFALLLPALFIAKASGDGLDTLVGEYQADRRDLTAASPLNWLPATRDREATLLSSWEARLDGLNYEALDATSRIDWQLLRTTLRERRDDLRLGARQLEEIEPLLAFSKPLQELLSARTRRELADPEASATALAQAAAGLKTLRKQLDAGRSKDAQTDSLRPGPVTALRAAAAVEELRTAMATWYALYDGFQPEFTWRVGKPYETLTAAMADLAGFLRRDLAAQKGQPEDPLVGDPIGAEALRTSLQAEMIPYSAEELIGIAEKEFAWCQAEMQKAATALGCANQAEALEKIKANHVPPGGQAALAIAEAGKAVRFLKDKDLVTVPPLAEETWGIAMLGPEQQKSLPYAVYGQPRIMVAYAHQSMSEEDKLEAMRGNNYAFLHIVTPHELIPGHHLQGFMARRHAAYRAPFNTPFLVEGWALHWEMLLWDQGYLQTPEEKVGALFWRMHRCARIIVSLKFHLNQMTPAEMIDFLVEKVGHERSGATSEVRRYIGGAYSPLYQVAYMIGGKQLTALQNELCAGPRAMSLRDFHDQVLRQGPIPIEMIRTALKKEALPKDWKPAWKFAGE